MKGEARSFNYVTCMHWARTVLMSSHSSRRPSLPLLNQVCTWTTSLLVLFLTLPQPSPAHHSPIMDERQIEKHIWINNAMREPAQAVSNAPKGRSPRLTVKTMPVPQNSQAFVASLAKPLRIPVVYDRDGSTIDLFPQRLAGVSSFGPSAPLSQTLSSSFSSAPTPHHAATHGTDYSPLSSPTTPCPAGAVQAAVTTEPTSILRKGPRDANWHQKEIKSSSQR